MWHSDGSKSQRVKTSPVWLQLEWYCAVNDGSISYGCICDGSSVYFPSGTSDDEMCNFYIMYYMESKHAVPYMDCMDHGSSSLFRGIPAEANVPIAVSPNQMSMMHGSEHKGTHRLHCVLLFCLLFFFIFAWFNAEIPTLASSLMARQLQAGGCPTHTQFLDNWVTA